MTNAATAKQEMDAETASLPELSPDELNALEQEAAGKGKNALAEDGLPDTFSEDDLAWLSDEERASMNEDDEFLRVVPKPDEGTDGNGTEPKPLPVPAAPVDQAADIEVDMAAISAKVQEQIKDRRAEIMDAYDDGDMTRAEMEAALSGLISEAAELSGTLAQEARQQAAADRQAQAKLNEWFDALSPYEKSNPELWSDDHVNAWDRALKDVNSDPALASLSHQDRIALAYETYAPRAARMGKPLKPLGGAASPAPRREQITPRPASERPPGPLTLPALPASDANAANDGRFAQIDRLMDTDPTAAERAVARLSPEDREAWLAGRD